MSLFGVGEFRSGVLAEIRLQEAFGLWQSQVKIGKRSDLETERTCLNVKQVAALPAIARNEVKVISSDAEGAREARRKQTNQRAIDVGEGKIALGLSTVYEARSGLRRIYRPGANPSEVPVQADRKENIT